MRFGWSLLRRRARQAAKEEQVQQKGGDQEVVAQIVNHLLKIGAADASGDGSTGQDLDAVLYEARHVADCMENGVYFIFSPRLVAGLDRSHLVYVPPHDFKSERRIVFL